MEGGEKDSLESPMPTRKRKSKAMDLKELFVIILGFVFALFGALLLITPSNYPIGSIPTSWNPLIGIVLITIGLILLVASGD